MNQLRANFAEKVKGQDKEETAVTSTPQSKTPTTPDDLTKIKGVGPTYANRLQSANIATYAQVKQLSVEELATILNINETWAAKILQEAQAIQ
jgi:predicted flap endonuclease-1-like 5' DNA nuclease